jgi:hypothetical protein
VYYFARCSPYLLCSRVCGQSKRLLGPLWEADAPRSLAPGCSPNAMPVSPQDWLHDWLTRACMSCLAFLRPYALKLLKPRGSMARSTASHAAPAPRWAIPRRFGPLTLELRYTACRQFASHWLLGGKGKRRVPGYAVLPGFTGLTFCQTIPGLTWLPLNRG